ncbi:MAG: hypothetical protein ACI94Y_004454 [Maribacter sp.]
MASCQTKTPPLKFILKREVKEEVLIKVEYTYH